MAHRIYGISFASVYPHYVTKVEKGLKRTARGDSADLDPGRAKDMVDEVIRWLTGYSQEELERALADKTNFQTFYGQAPAMNPARTLITGTICGIRVQEIEDPLMRDIRYLDKLIDELAKGKAMAKVLRA
jgi:hypothetical protein